MEVLFPRCCGLDVHKREVVACLVSTEPNGTMRKEVRVWDDDAGPPGAG